MSIFNDKQIEAMRSGLYRCPNCNSLMHWEDEFEDVLICDKCGTTIDGDRYGFTDDEYEALYPSFDDISIGKTETYEEVYEALDD